ncbi:MAG: sulfite exporter TauE/SafE family protein, partial [Actinobacteria bacterium]|nr:sulfite exporter TauE/SafE family protein [Actinomycetota bacterium]
MFLLIFLTAVVAGAFGSMLGIGGALILVPVITLFLDVPMKVAIGA